MVNKVILSGSRKLKINRKDSDYDFIYIEISSENNHYMLKGMFKNRKCDIHVYKFENKKELLKYYYENRNSFSLPSLIYPEFREFWGISLDEALELLEAELIRSYEWKYFIYQYFGDRVNRSELKRLYEKYKNSLGS